MTYNEKKSLYESIMKDVAKTVKKHLNENKDSLENNAQFAKKIGQLIMHHIVMKNETEYSIESFREYFKKFKDNKDLQQKFFDQMYELITNGTTLSVKW